LTRGARADYSSRVIVVETQRLRLRWFEARDAAFTLELINEPGWVRFIGDKGAKTVDDARRYLETGPMSLYARFGFGLYLVELAATAEAIGMCGLVRRAGLADVDVGFAFLERFQTRGYAFEAATAVMAHARRDLGLSRVVAIVTPDNVRSARLLRKLGFRNEGPVRLKPDAEALDLYATSI